MLIYNRSILSCSKQTNRPYTHRYPLITLSTRAQTESKRAKSSVFDASKRIVEREGFSGLFAGLDSALLGISVTNFVYYYCTPLVPVREEYHKLIPTCQGTNGRDLLSSELPVKRAEAPEN